MTTVPEIKQELGRARYFTAQRYKDELQFHFRQYESKDGNQVPTKRGVYLKPNQMKNLLLCASTLVTDAEMAFSNGQMEYRSHLGYGVYAIVTKFKGQKYIDIRRFWKPADAIEAVATTNGCLMKLDEFDKFLKLIPIIHQNYPELNLIQDCQCMFQPNQLGYLQCSMCNPFDFQNW